MAGDDLRKFIREITGRNELVWKGVMGELAQGRLVLAGFQNEIADVRADLKAHTETVLSLIDEIKGSPGG